MAASEKPEQDSGDAGRKAGEVDVQRLADRVYRLMLAEIRLERARGTGTEH